MDESGLFDALLRLRAHAEVLRRSSPRTLSRDPGPTGEAWDGMVGALDEVTSLMGGVAEMPARHPIGNASVVATGSVVAASAAMERAVSQCDDENVHDAWGALLVTLLESEREDVGG